MDTSTLLGYLLFGDFGILTMTPTYLFGLLFPLITVFYFFIACLEESRLFYRIANRCDKPLLKIGLSGHSLIPMLMGFGCVTVALASLSLLESKRERLIASVLLCVIVPCSAQTAIIVALAFLLPPGCFFVYVVMIFLTFLALSLLLNTILPRELILNQKFREVPLRKPPFKKILQQSVKSGITFVAETAFPFVVGSIIISFLSYMNCFSALSVWLAPFTEGFLRLPKEASNLFILSIIKRDLGVAGLLSVIQSGSFTDEQLAVCLTIMTLFVPCFASVIILFKQEKPPAAILVWLGSFVIAMAVGKLASLLILS